MNEYRNLPEPARFAVDAAFDAAVNTLRAHGFAPDTSGSPDLLLNDLARALLRCKGAAVQS